MIVMTADTARILTLDASGRRRATRSVRPGAAGQTDRVAYELARLRVADTREPPPELLHLRVAHD
jgi:hypothetical protein